MTVSLHRIEVALKLPTSTAALLLRAEAIVDAMTNNSWFPTPSPSLAKVLAAIVELRTAQTTSLSRARGTATVRDAKRRVLVGLLKRLGSYVEGIAEDSPENAAAIIESAGMFVKGRTAPNKPPLAVTSGPRQGEVVFTAKAVAKNSTYEWQWREDGAATWNAGGMSTQSSKTLGGLTPGKMVWFRFRAMVGGRMCDWFQPVGMIVR